MPEASAGRAGDDAREVVDNLDPSVIPWLTRFADALGVQPPSADEVAALLSLAGVAAHGSARQAAPVACWLAARAGTEPTAALDVARAVADD